ncbi:helix-turn-helix domain-containing protein [Streptomyces sp. NPDC059651]|uniref:helix-turn-helix domain-containing protein n=1 Tax=Streptomyces sp. NPDC059651 TaxID=3346897 RepID=UPI0036B99677
MHRNGPRMVFRPTPHRLPRRSTALSLLLPASPVRDEEGLARWSSRWRDAAMPVSVTTSDGREPDGHVVTHRLGAVTVSAIVSGAQRVTRVPARQPGEGGSDLVFMLHTRGAATYRGRTADILAGPSALLLHDSERFCSLSYEGPFTAQVLRVPARAVGLSAGRLGAVTGTALPSESGTGALLASLLPAVASSAGWAARVGERLGVALVDLVTLLMLEHGVAETVQDGPRGDLVRRINTYVDEHFRNPSLSPESIAKAHHISLRYLHRVFEPEEVTVGRLIQRRRLEESARELARPGGRTVAVAAVAQLCGFTNAAHFSRAFRQLHGCSPLEWRSRALAASAVPVGTDKALVSSSVAGR